MPDAGADESELADSLLDALTRQEMELVDTLSIDTTVEPTPSTGRRRRDALSIPARQSIRIDLELGDEEDAVILLEQDGVFSWSFPAKVSTAPSPERGPARGARQVRTGRMATFEIDVHANASRRRRSLLPSLLTELVYEKVRAYVLRFAARVAASSAMSFLERNVREGLVNTKATDPESWGPVDPKMLKLPKDRQGSILLMVHGTFSSTLGSFGALGATPWGVDFLENAQMNYDLILGFDHRTLSKDPLQNADDMLTALKAIGHKNQAAPRIDIVCFSRGGLVARSLIEYLLPASKWKPRIGAVAFVGCTNEGTLLAEPDNWRQLIDLYTNVSMAAFKVLEMLPSAGIGLGSRILRHGINSLGAFVKYLTTHAVTENAVPGLAAMEPDGTFVTEINKEQPGQPTAGEAQYVAITSDFNPIGALDRDGLSGLPKKLLLMLADGFVDELMGGENDLVVHVDSMTSIDRRTGPFVKDVVRFKASPDIYHTIYFTRPEVASALNKWLGIDPSIAGGTAALRGSARTVVQPGDIVSRSLSATANTDVLVAPKHESINDVLASVRSKEPDFVVLRRTHRGKILNYAVKEEELRDLTKGYPASTRLEEVYESGVLLEIDRSKTIEPTVGMAYGLRDERKKRPEIASRTVILDKNKVIGVVPTREDLPTLDELIVMADIESGSGEEDLSWLGPARGTRAKTVEMPNRGARSRERSPKKKYRKRPAELVWCHFAARMDEESELGKSSTIEVEISREEIEHALEGAAEKRTRQVEADRKVIIELIPKLNFRAQGDDRQEIDVPAPGDPQLLFFKVRPTNVGEGEVWVIARQGSKDIVTLRLRTVIVRGAPTQRGVAMAAAGVARPPIVQFDPWMTLRVFEQRDGAKVRFLFDLDARNASPQPIIDRDYSKFLNVGIQEHFDSLYREIQDGWIGAAGNVDAFTSELRAIGSSMFRQLVPKGMQRIIWENRSRIKNILVYSDEPVVPWEIAHLRDPDARGMPEDLHFLGQKGLVRWLHGQPIPPATTRIREGKVYYVVPDYPHQKFKLPDAQAEKKFLEASFKAKSWPHDSVPLLRKLEKPGSCDLFHFAGHGLAEGEDIDRARIMMRGKVRGGKYLPDYLAATTIGEFANLNSGNQDRPMVMLNACQVGRLGYRLTDIGGFAPAFLRAGAGIFVSALWSVGDYAAQTFTEELYRQLKNQKNLTETAINAREAARKAGDTSWLAYTIYGNPDGVVEWKPK